MNNELLVLIAQAHSESTPGKRSPDGRLREYKWSREISRMISDRLLEYGIHSIIINPGEKEVKLSTQVKIANEIYRANKGIYKNIVLISPHVNASSLSGWTDARGWLVYVYKKASNNSRRLAGLLADQAYDKYELRGNRWIPDCRYMEANFMILKDTDMPAVLTENMFQTNKQDVDFLLSDEGKQIIVDLHVEALKEFIENE